MSKRQSSLASHVEAVTKGQWTLNHVLNRIEYAGHHLVLHSEDWRKMWTLVDTALSALVRPDGTRNDDYQTALDSPEYKAFTKALYQIAGAEDIRELSRQLHGGNLPPKDGNIEHIANCDMCANMYAEKWGRRPPKKANANSL